ncbi:MAG TPA: 4Fe-4S cluster-binding domain-containing protein, partial [bacterium]|nr:4Fe-4S cluster-binding domain-containing protein [bacterium]
FAYAEGLTEVAQLLRKQNLTIMSYSGFTVEEIRTKGNFYVSLLEALDILVDGEYKRELNVNRLWRSSANQRVLFLTDRYIAYQAHIDEEYRELEFTLNTNQITTTGFPEVSILKNLTNHRE